VAIGMLPLARRDVDRFRHINMLVPRLTEQALSMRQQRSVVHRPSFEETLTWLEIFGGDTHLVEHWRAVRTQLAAQQPHTDEHAAGDEAGHHPRGPRRRRRRRRGRSRRHTQ
jgi:hypothetical protein